MKKSFFTSILLSLILLGSCKDGPQLMPTISGKAGEVVVVIDKAQWESEPGSILRGSLTQDQPFLPQKEPMFSLINIPHNAFTNIFKTHRNIIILNLSSDLKESKIIYQKDIWAAPQIVVTISAPDGAGASALLTSQSSKLISVIEQSERNRNIANAKKYEEKALKALVSETFGGSPYFPKGYSLRKKSNDFVWISYETTYTNQGIIIFKFPNKEGVKLSKEYLIEMRNKVMQESIPGPLPNTYMTTNMLIEPVLSTVSYNSREFNELRGLWEVQNDFMGGPFVEHIFPDKTGENIIVVEAFVYAPRYDKRNYLRQVESLLYSFEFF